MIGVFVTFRSDQGLDRTTVLGIAAAASGQFEGMPGLRSKAFTWDDDARSATNVYIWESEDAARAFFTPQLTERVTGLYGVAPEIRFVEVAALVDNAAPAIA